MNASALIAKLLAQRERIVELEPGKTITLRRPPEAEMPRFRAGISVEQIAEHTVGWSGITEADLLGAAVGAADAVPFDQGLWAVVVADRGSWFKVAAAGLATSISDHLAAQAAAAKN